MHFSNLLQLENGNLTNFCPHAKEAISKEYIPPVLPLYSIYIAYGNKREKIGILHFCSNKNSFAR